MPKLSDAQLALLNKYVAQNPGPGAEHIPLPGYDKDSVSCWKWALFGLDEQLVYNGKSTPTIIHRPGVAFQTILLGTPVDPDSIWHECTDLLKQCSQQAQTFGPDKPHTADQWAIWRKWRSDVMKGACNFICKKIGLIVEGQSDAYTLVMHYDDLSDKTPACPNETHWWIEVDLENGKYVCIEEHFPIRPIPPYCSSDSTNATRRRTISGHPLPIC